MHFYAHYLGLNKHLSYVDMLLKSSQQLLLGKIYYLHFVNGEKRENQSL